MERFRKSILFSCILLFLFTCPPAFGQSQAARPIRGVLSVDSAGVKTTQFSGFEEPTRIGISSPEPITQPFSNGYNTPPATSPQAHWVICHLSGTQWQWLIRKPGCYAGKSLDAVIETNGKVLIDFGGFANLDATDESGDALEMYFGVASPTTQIDGVNWMDCDQMNSYYIDLHGTPYVSYAWSLWQKVCVERWNRAAEYEDAAFIAIDLLNLSPWVDGHFTDRTPANK
jgi:hypothetical protein